MSYKSLVKSMAVSFTWLLLTNRFLFNQSWPMAIKGSLFVAVGTMVTTALFLKWLQSWRR